MHNNNYLEWCYLTVCSNLVRVINLMDSSSLALKYAIIMISKNEKKLKLCAKFPPNSNIDNLIKQVGILREKENVKNYFCTPMHMSSL